jgi:hypothetical protein
MASTISLPSQSAGGTLEHKKCCLPIYLSWEWLRDNEINLQSGLVIRHLPPSHPFPLVDTIIYRFILKARDLAAGPEQDQALGNVVLKRFATNLTPDSVVGGIFHVRGNHWVAVVVDLPSSKILYGDPAGGSRDSNLLSALVWFCKTIVPSVPSFDEFHHKDLPCPAQNLSTDSWNCGVFSYNALCHYLFPSTTPLLLNTERAGALLSFLKSLALVELTRYVASVHLFRHHL